MAPLIIILVGVGALVALLESRGNVFSELSDLGEIVSSTISDEEASVGLSDDPIAVAMPLIKQFESWSSKAYPDPKGQTRTYSIGWGHQIKPGEPYDQNSEIGREEGDGLLRNDIAGAYSCIQQHCNADLSVQQTAALISFVYNVGCTQFTSSTMLQLLNDGEIDAAANEFPRWIHANGEVDEDLVSRRDQEQALFNS